MKFQSLLTRGTGCITYASQWMVAVLTSIALPSTAFADLPTLEEPTQTGSGGIRSTAQGYVYDGIILAGLVLTAIAFLWVGTSCLAAFNDARARGEWSKFVVTTFVGVLLLLVVIWLATEAAPILSQ